MLSKVLKKEDCAGCRFCCSFRRQSLWELPRLTTEFADGHKQAFDGSTIDYITTDHDSGRFCVTDLTGGYQTDDPEEEVACPFLDPDSGCILSGDEKPFECSAWPLRLMRMPDGTLAVCLTPTCPSINKVELEIMRRENAASWKKQFEEYAKEHPYIIKDYREGFIVL